MCKLRVRRRLVLAVAGVVGLVVGADTGLAGTLSARRGDGEGKGTENSVMTGAANAKGTGIPGKGVGARSFGFTEGSRRALAVRAADSESGEGWAGIRRRSSCGWWWNVGQENGAVMNLAHIRIVFSCP